MAIGKRVTVVVILAMGIALLQTAGPSAEPVAVRHIDGTSHGFLALRSTTGSLLASGDQAQVARGERITNKVVFRFKDGSIHDETAIFSQKGHLRLIAYHLVQKGPAFPRALDMTIDPPTGQVEVRYTDRGENKSEIEHLDLPADLGNGMMNAILKNLEPNTLPASVSYVAATPKPRIVKLTITSAGLEPFSAAGAGYKATHYVVKIDIGGVEGLLAPLVGKEPPDSHVWILRGEAPVFVKSATTLFMGGPIWRIEPASPVWPEAH